MPSLPADSLVLDLNLDDEPRRLQQYMQQGITRLGGCAVKRTIGEMRRQATPDAVLFGINALPAFLDSPLWELSAPDKNSRQLATETLQSVGISFRLVSDSPGMVRPRVLAMIINEAFFSLYEGVATEEEIDQAMKLGTAYPYGPFEWCNRIGLHNVYEVLDALHRSDNPLRYRICPLLEERYRHSLQPLR